MLRVVPDASVILKWVLPAEDEPNSADAIELRNSFVEGELACLVPSLWRFEVGNTLGRRYPEQALALVRGLSALQMPEPDLQDHWLEHCIDLMRRFNVTFYDAAYHALALTESAILVTADSRYLKAIGETCSTCHLATWRDLV